MPTQSNKQTQNVKVVVNNKVGCCPDKPKRRRRKPAAPQPPPEPQLPNPVQPSWAKGISSQAVRPVIYAPQTTMIQPENGLNSIPPYFERQFTNQQAAMDDMRQALRNQFDALHNELAVQYVNNGHLQRIAQTVEKLHNEAVGEMESVVGTPQASSISSPMSSQSYPLPETPAHATTLNNNDLFEPTPALRPLVIPPASPQEEVFSPYNPPLEQQQEPRLQLVIPKPNLEEYSKPNYQIANPMAEALGLERAIEKHRSDVAMAAAAPPPPSPPAEEPQGEHDIEEIARVWGADHPYTKAVEAYNNWSKETSKWKKDALARKIRKIATKNNITFGSREKIDDIITKLAGLPVR